MATTKILLDTRRSKANGTFPLKIRVTHETKSFLHSLGLNLSKDDWDEELRKVKPSYPEAKQLNQTIIQEELRIQRLIYDLNLKEENYSIAELKCLVRGKQKVAEDCFLPRYVGFSVKDFKYYL